MTGPYRCPACIGIVAHDAVLKLMLEPIERSVVEAIRKLGNLKTTRLSDDENRLIDEFAVAIISLQDNCQFELFEKYIGVIMHCHY